MIRHLTMYMHTHKWLMYQAQASIMCTLHVTKVDINIVIYRKPQNITTHTHTCTHVCIISQQQVPCHVHVHVLAMIIGNI